MRVLIIEDDVDLAANISDYLESKGCQIDHAPDGVLGLHLATTTQADVIVLDICLPGLDGIEVCRKLKEQSNFSTPIIMLTARDSLEDKLEGFEVGADDYLIKPFALAELYCRLSALHRRGIKNGASTYQIDNLEIDSKTRRVERGGILISLSKLEFEILVTLAAASPAPLSKGELARRVWGEDYVEDETIRSHIYQLRKLVDRPFSAPLLQTVRGYGHALREAEPTP